MPDDLELYVSHHVVSNDVSYVFDDILCIIYNDTNNSGYGDNRHGGDRGGRAGYAGRDGRNREYDRRSGTGRSVQSCPVMVLLLSSVAVSFGGVAAI